MTTNLLTFADADVTLRWREPYITAGLNKHDSVLLPAGIYRGFRLEGTVNNAEIRIAPDASTNDHVAFYRTQTDYGLRVRRTNAILLDLTAYAGQNGIVVALYATYAIGTTTAVYLRAYTLAEYTSAPEATELVVLGVVDVPSSAPITSIAYTYRTSAGLQTAPGMSAPIALLRNGGFEAGLAESTDRFAAIFWEKAVTVGTGSWRLSLSAASVGQKGLVIAVSSGSLTGSCVQQVNCPVRAGNILRLSIRYRVVIPSTSGALTAVYTFLDAAGNVGSSTTVTIPTGSSTGGSFVTLQRSLTAPTGVTHLRDFTLQMTSLGFGSTGDAIFIDEVSLSLVEVEATVEAPMLSRLGGMEVLTSLLLADGTTSPAYGVMSLFRHHANVHGGSPGTRHSNANDGPSILDLTGRVVLGKGLSALPATPRVETPIESSNSYTLLWQSSGGSGGSLRFYAIGAGGLAATVNALFNGSGWERDNGTGVGSFFLYLGTEYTALYDHGVSLGDSWSNSVGTGNWEEILHLPSIGAAAPVRVQEDLRVYQNEVVDKSLTVGTGLANDNTGGGTARILTPRAASPARTLLWEMGGVAGNPVVRFYRTVLTGVLEVLEVSINALWSNAGSTWSRDSSSADSTKYVFSPTGLDVYRSTSSSWGDGAWTSTSLRLAADPNPLATFAPAVNSLHASQIPKAWGVVTLDGAGNVALTEGFNIASVSQGGGVLIVTFARAFANGNYSVKAERVLSAANQWRDAVSSGHVTTGMLISLFYFDGSAVAVENPATTACTVTFAVFGKQ